MADLQEGVEVSSPGWPVSIVVLIELVVWILCPESSCQATFLTVSVMTDERSERADISMNQPDSRNGSSLIEKMAVFISRVFNPIYVAVPTVLAASLHVSQDILHGVLWWLLYITFSTIVPFVDLLVRLRLGKVSDFHVTKKEERTVPMLCNIGYIIIGVALMIILGAPRTIVAMAVTSLFLVMISLLVNLWWKISVHAFGLFEIYTMLVLVFRSWTFVLFNSYLLLMLSVVCWARTYLKKHTPGQVLAGALAGIGLPVVVFWAFGLL
jgi:membrane-associated phospholipid phosphatase